MEYYIAMSIYVATLNRDSPFMLLLLALTNCVFSVIAR